MPSGLHARIALLVRLLRERRCLLVLDNGESLLQSAGRAGAFRAEHADYGQLLRAIGQRQHASCLLLTSRERPLELARLEAETPLVRTLALSGLPEDSGRTLLHERGLAVSEAEANALVTRYSGNPLALRLVAAAIHDLFGGNVATFLRDETLIFDDIRDVLDQQWERLAPLERELLTALAILREPAMPGALQRGLAFHEPLGAVVEALSALQRRSLLQPHDDALALQNVIAEYVTNRLVACVVAELDREVFDVFARHPLLQAQAKRHVRQAQTRLILAPVVRALAARRSPNALDALFRRSLDALRAEGRPTGYAAGNILNLLLHAQRSARRYDFSGLCVWQADARGARLPEVNFTGADLVGSAFNDAFRSLHAIAWSPNGALLAGGTSDGAVVIWRVADGALSATFAGHSGFVWSVAWSPDGEQLASSAGDHSAYVWRPAHETRRKLRGHADMLSELAWSPDGVLLAGGSRDGAVYLWDGASLELRRTLGGPGTAVLAIAWSRDGRLLCAYEDRELRVWEVESGACVGAFASPTAGATAVAWCDHDALIVGCGPLQPMHVWDAHTFALLDTVRVPAGFGELAASPDGALVALGGPHRGVYIWDVARRHIARALSDATTEGSGNLAWSPDGTLLARPSTESALQVWDGRTGQLLDAFWGYNGWVYSVAWSPDSATLAAGTHAQQVELWDLEGRRSLRTLEGEIGWVLSVAWSPSGTRLAIGTRDGAVRLWHAGVGAALSVFGRHDDAVECVAWSREGERLASASRDGTVRVWDTYSGQLLQVGTCHSAPVISVAWASDERVASGGRDKTVRVWDSRSGRVLASFAGHNAGVLSVAWHPGGERLASGGGDGVVRVWDARTGAPLQTLRGHTTTITNVAWSPDGALLASVSNDQTLRVWDVEAGACRRVLRGHSGWIRAVAWSPDGRWLASGSYDETFKVWDATTGACMATVRCARPYEGARIAGVTGITASQRAALVALGATEEAPQPSTAHGVATPFHP